MLGRLVMCVLLGALLATPVRAQAYHVVDIGTAEGFTDSSVFGINESGLVVGQLAPSPRAFQYSVAGGFVLLDDPLFGSEAAALAVNDAGVVVGRYRETFFSENGLRAVRWSTPTTPVKLGPTAGTNNASAVSINSAGQVVGTRSTSGFPSGTSTAVLWSAEGLETGLNPEGDASRSATGINDAAQVVGIDSLGLLEGSDAFIWSEATGSQELIGLEGDTRVAALAINNAGVAVGSSGTFTDMLHAVRWPEPDQPQDLGLLPEGTSSEARAINDAGTIVGECFTASFQHACVWTEETGMRDLNDLSDAAAIGLTLQSARAINESGQIAGLAFLDEGGNGNQRGFLATPVPESAAVWPAAPILGWLGLRRRAQRSEAR